MRPTAALVGLADFPALRALRYGLRPEMIALSRLAVEPTTSSSRKEIRHTRRPESTGVILVTC
jgi:hypothetical protein